MRIALDRARLLMVLIALPMALGVSGQAAAAAGTAHPAVASEMNGVWLPDSRRSERPAQWPLTESARQAAERYKAQYGPVDPTVDDANASCIPEPMPYPMRLIAQYPFEILFTPGRMTMFFEIFGNVRRIPVGSGKPVLIRGVGVPNGHEVEQARIVFLLTETSADHSENHRSLGSGL